MTEGVTESGSIHGIPFVPDRNCPRGYIYLINNDNLYPPHPLLLMTETNDTLFRGTAGRRTFLREIDDGKLVAYHIVAENQKQERFCTRTEWDAWCKDHAPPVAMPGMTVVGNQRSVTVLRRFKSGTLEVACSETRLLTQDKADRLVRKMLAEANSLGLVTEAAQDEVEADSDRGPNAI